MYRIFLFTALMLWNVGCSELSYPPPAQRTFTAPPAQAVLQMKAGLPVQPWASILSDVVPATAGTDWRWLRSHPEFEFRIVGDGNWRLTARLTAVPQVLSAVHAQHVTFIANGVTVGSTEINRPGTFDYSFPAGDVFRNSGTARARLDIDPCLLQASANEQQQPYCVLIHSIGFVSDRP